MSATTTPQPSVTPTTDRAVSAANSLISLAQRAEQAPIVKSDLQAMFDSYSHSSAAPLILSLATVSGAWLAGHNIVADNMLLVVVIGSALTGIGYVWQWAAMKLTKPVMPTPSA
jgi:hypothetical protein